VLTLASVWYVAVAVAFAAGGVGYALGQDWAAAMLVAAAAFSTVMLVAIWDGKPGLLVEKGVVGIAINVAVAYLLFVR
jgi:hypothetical protein